MTIKDFSIGDSVYIRCYDRYPKPHFNVYNGNIQKIGRKYITVIVHKEGFSFNRRFESDNLYPEKFDCIDTGESGVSMFKDESAAHDYDEWNSLRKWFYKLTTDSKHLSLDQLRRIKTIVEE